MKSVRLSSESAIARRFWIDERGSTMVEFSIVAFLFVLLLLGIGEFGIATWAKNSVADAAREGTRWAMVRGQKSGQVTDAAGVQAYVQSRSSLSPITVTTVWAPDKEAGSTVAVTVSYAYKRVGLVIPNKTLSSTSQMVIVY
jgi:Flp pilus assembly protein TadG